jgi:hypothetical protein
MPTCIRFSSPLKLRSENLVETVLPRTYHRKQQQFDPITVLMVQRRFSHPVVGMFVAASARTDLRWPISCRSSKDDDASVINDIKQVCLRLRLQSPRCP